MKTLRKFILQKHIYLALIASVLWGCTTNAVQAEVMDPDPTTSSKKIKIALLLDTSNSMDGLINQAKSQLWSLVNELAKAECNGEVPLLQIALYEYGNDQLAASENYIRMVTPLTNDLDKISQDLFALKTNGGSEFCGAVIQQSLKELDWSSDSTDLQIVFIAGNEPFTQGAVPYFEACQNANQKDVIVNSIYCGDFEEGVRTQWKHGAKITNGTYMSIDHNKVSQEIETPYDDEIVRLNTDLNKTYIAYGKQGQDYYLNQEVQDLNAVQMDKKVLVQRSVSKSKAHYKSGSAKWDMVNKMEEEEVSVEDFDEEALPAEMKEMDMSERKVYVEEKSEERKKIENEIGELNIKREKFIAENQKVDDDELLQNALIKAIHEQAKTKNISIK